MSFAVVLAVTQIGEVMPAAMANRCSLSAS
jgi:hypothetical protein